MTWQERFDEEFNFFKETQDELKSFIQSELDKAREEGYREGSKNTYGELSQLTSYKEGFEMGKAEILLAREEGRQEVITARDGIDLSLFDKGAEQERTRILGIIEEMKKTVLIQIPGVVSPYENQTLWSDILWEVKKELTKRL